jgi:hypothetical protein
MFISGTSNNPPSDPDREVIHLQHNKFISYTEKFCFLGSIISKDLKDGNKIANIINQARKSFYSIRKGVF